MPRFEAEQLADSIWQQLKPVVVSVLDCALTEREASLSAPASSDAEERYIAERVEKQLASLSLCPRAAQERDSCLVASSRTAADFDCRGSPRFPDRGQPLWRMGGCPGDDRRHQRRLVQRRSGPHSRWLPDRHPNP